MRFDSVARALLGASALLAAVCLFAACNSEPLDVHCVLPGCKRQIDFIRDRAGCVSCSNCARLLGRCDGKGLACEPEQLDLDRDPSNGCEADASEAPGDMRLHSTTDVALMTINASTFSLPITVELVALENLDPTCDPSDGACAYALHALKFTFADFEFDEVSWRAGSATISGPIPAVGDPTGIGVTDASLIATFVFEQDERTLRATSFGTAELRVNPNDSMGGTMLLRADLDFDGYQVQEILLNAELVARP